MGLTIIRSAPDLLGGEYFTLKQRLWRTNDDRLVPEGDPAAAFLFGTVGQKVSLAKARKYGLVIDEPVAAELPKEAPPVIATVETVSSEVDVEVDPDSIVPPGEGDPGTAATDAAAPEDEKAANAEPETKVAAPAETKVVAPAERKRRNRGGR